MGFMLVPVSLSRYGARLTEEEEERISTKWHFCCFQVSYLKHSINGLDRSGHAPVCCLSMCNPSTAEYEPFYT